MFGRGGCGPGRGRMKFMMGGGGGPFRHFMGGRGLLEGIDLSDQQVELIAELKQRSFGKMAHGGVDMMELRHQLFRELGKAEIDKAKINEIKTKIKEQKALMTDMMIDNITAFAEILTPEQRKKVRIKKIRQFLGSGDMDDDDEHHDRPFRDRD